MINYSNGPSTAGVAVQRTQEAASGTRLKEHSAVQLEAAADLVAEFALELCAFADRVGARESEVNSAGWLTGVNTPRAVPRLAEMLARQPERIRDDVAFMRGVLSQIESALNV